MLLLNYLINTVSLQSTPEQTTYDDNNWSPPKSTDAKKEYFATYRQKKLEAFKGTGIIEKISPESFLHKDISHYSDMNGFVEYNIKNGDRRQYATHIPHLIMDIRYPLKINDVTKLKFRNT